VSTKEGEGSCMLFVDLDRTQRPICRVLTAVIFAATNGADIGSMPWPELDIKPLKTKLDAGSVCFDDRFFPGPEVEEEPPLISRRECPQRTSFPVGKYARREIVDVEVRATLLDVHSDLRGKANRPENPVAAVGDIGPERDSR